MSSFHSTAPLTPLINVRAASEIVNLLGSARYLELLGELVDQAEEKAAVIALATLQRSEVTVQQQLHSFRGAACSLFAQRLAGKIECLERSSDMPSDGQLASLRDCAEQTYRSFSERQSLAVDASADLALSTIG